ncbi:flagellar biosynthesis protein FlhB [Thermodesulforhabdus norvegica]|uniref:Flagellar biosynthetic protein FlhB n=1 Tax=Thermodesulforhabdus norvegica TaxID=39841 RepID=A0A1I4R5A1_9BACT|nr:flagellar biosynthesis protein FlhB [Thermodesulforhabdus norvegica]SFM47441.1 flagellar biosynthetic protein FlhB [Thermodesulforhabdus norvegica]
MPAGAQERTEKPTPKRLQKARSEGKLAKSREINTLASLIGGALGLWFSLAIIHDQFRALLQYLWGDGFGLITTGDLTSGLTFRRSVESLLISALPAVALSLIFSVLANLYQNKGFLFVWKNLVRFDLSAIHPVNGLKRLFSLRSLVDLGKAVIKFVVVSYVMYSLFRSKAAEIAQTVYLSNFDISRTLGILAFIMLFKVIAVMVLLAYLDWRYQKWQYIKDLMMTKQEVKEEHRQAEGDPKIKSKIRAKQLQIARARMLAQVPKAEVVVTNPTHFAVALMYRPGEMSAPKVVAKGVDFMARRIIRIARRHGVPVVYNPPLARALYRQVPLEGTIPVALYRAVAKVLAYVYHQRKRRWQADAKKVG